jgi:diguanylate cyclase (GGDEF)-like protein
MSSQPQPVDRATADQADAALPAMALELLQASELIVAIFDGQDVLRFANPAFEAAFHMRPDGRSNWVDLMRANYAHRRGSVVGMADFETWLAGAKARRGKLPFRSFEGDLYDGRWIWMTETTLPGGWMLCLACDVTNMHEDGRSLRQTRDQALRVAQTDSLTGLSNRTHLVQQLQSRIAQAHPFVLVLLDLDRFKRINDNHGHLAGDAVLCDFARRLQTNTRREDGCGRVGGEEFMMLLHGADLAQAQVVTGRLLDQVRAAAPAYQGRAIGYTVSAGLAAWHPGEAQESVYSRADQALYRAKQQGRDRMCAAEPGAAAAGG